MKNAKSGSVIRTLISGINSADIHPSTVTPAGVKQGFNVTDAQAKNIAQKVQTAVIKPIMQHVKDHNAGQRGNPNHGKGGRFV